MGVTIGNSVSLSGRVTHFRLTLSGDDLERAIHLWAGRRVYPKVQERVQDGVRVRVYEFCESDRKGATAVSLSEKPKASTGTTVLYGSSDFSKEASKLLGRGIGPIRRSHRHVQSYEWVGSVLRVVVLRDQGELRDQWVVPAVPSPVEVAMPAPPKATSTLGQALEALNHEINRLGDQSLAVRVIQSRPGHPVSVQVDVK